MIDSIALRRPVRLLAAVALVVTASARATSYTISTTVDDAVVNGNCTLREALRAARDDAPVDACAAGTSFDTIVLPAGTYPFGGQEVMIGSGTVRIHGQTFDPFAVRIDLGNAGRFLTLFGPGSYEIRGVEIANGWTGGGSVGGAIDAVSAPLAIRDFRFVSNDAGIRGGALSYSSVSSAAGLLLANGTFLSNTVSGADPTLKAGGAAYVELGGGARGELRDVAFVGNSLFETSSSGSAAKGGALYVTAAGVGSSARLVRTLYQVNSISNASTDVFGWAQGGALAGFSGEGGRIEVFDCRVLSNSASAAGVGAVENPGVSLEASLSTLWVDRCLLDANTAPSAADARDLLLSVFGASASAAVTNTQITFGSGSGLWVETNTAVDLGHLTIADYPVLGAHLFNTAPGVLRLQNSVIAFNGLDLDVGGTISQQTNFVGGNPLFVDQPTGNYRLSVASPAIGAGTDAVVTLRLADGDHLARRVGTTDQGCYEHGGLFADDFEVGDPGSWSQTTPRGPSTQRTAEPDAARAEDFLADSTDPTLTGRAFAHARVRCASTCRSCRSPADQPGFDPPARVGAAGGDTSASCAGGPDATAVS